MASDPLTGDARIFCFGTFEVDMRSSEVRKQGLRIRVQGQPLKVLVVFLERPGEVITREELRQGLWPDNTFVDFEHGLNSALTRLRQALADSAGTPRYIETLPRQGYRFIAPVVLHRVEARALPAAANGPLKMKPRPAVPGTIRFGVAFGALAIAVFGGLASWRASNQQEPQTVLDQLTQDLGLSTDPAISPDGKLLAYASDRSGGHLNIWLKQLSTTGKSIQLTHFDADASQPAFSPDGTKIAFRGDGDRGGIYVMTSIGGEPLRIADFGRDPRFSPDGNWIAFWVAADSARTSGVSKGAVYIIPVSGGPARRVGPEVSVAPVWASDSQRLLMSKTMPESVADWLLVPINGSPALRTGVLPVLRRQGFSLEMGMPSPLPAAWSGEHIIFSAKRGDTVNIWRIRLPPQDPHASSPAQQLTFGAGNDVNPSPATGGNLVFASLTEHTAIWSLPLEPNRVRVTGNLQRITESTASEVTPGTTPDGRYVAYTSDRAKSQDVYIKDLETGKEVALAATSDPEWHPVFSRDGSRVAYTNRGANAGIYVVPARGGFAEKVADGSGFVWDWSQDNQRLLFRKDHRTTDIRVLDFSSKTESVFLHRDGVDLFQAKFSPDDRWVTIEMVRTVGDSRLYVVPLKNGMPGDVDSWIPIVDENGWADKPRWSPDGNTLYFISQRDGFRCVWAQPLNEKTKHPSGPPMAVQHFHSANLSLATVPVSFLEIDVGRNRLLLTLGELNGNIWRSRIPDRASN